MPRSCTRPGQPSTSAMITSTRRGLGKGDTTATCAHSALAGAVGSAILIPTVTSRVGERGQITIEKSIREQLMIYAGDETVQRIEDGRIVIEMIPGRHRRSLAGVLSGKTGRTPPDESWEALRDAAWETPSPDRSE